MKPLRTSRHAAFAAALFIWAQTAGFTQTLGGPKAVLTETDAYLPAKAQLIAPANVGEVVLHPQGRYALIKQEEAELPPGPVIGKSTTGAASLLLYDAKLRKTRSVWERKADGGGGHKVLQIEWIAQTNCAVVVTLDQLPTSNTLALNPPNAAVYTLLFFNFDKSLAPRVLVTAADAVSVGASPIKPLFFVQNGEQIRIASAPQAVFGPPLPISPSAYLGGAWTKDGASVYGTDVVGIPATPTTKESAMRKWFTWNGKADKVSFVDGRPKDETIAQKTPPPALPVALRTGTFVIPAVSQAASLPAGPADKTAPQAPPKMPPADVLHPLFLETVAAPQTKSSVLLAPDADRSYLLADQSTVLYESDDALYAVPLVKINAKVYAEEIVKAAAMRNAKQVGLGILMYTQDYDEVFPPETDFARNLGPYLKNDSVFQGFSYVRPGVNIAAISEAAKTVMGYVGAPGGRAVLFTDGHVVWEPQKPPKP